MDGVAKVFQSNAEIYAGVENIKKKPIKAPNLMVKSRTAMYRLMPLSYMDGFVQERRNSIANALGLRLSCTNPSICQGQLRKQWYVIYVLHHSVEYMARLFPLCLLITLIQVRGVWITVTGTDRLAHLLENIHLMHGPNSHVKHIKMHVINGLRVIRIAVHIIIELVWTVQ